MSSSEAIPGVLLALLVSHTIYTNTDTMHRYKDELIIYKIIIELVTKLNTDVLYPTPSICVGVFHNKKLFEITGRGINFISQEFDKLRISKRIGEAHNNGKLNYFVIFI